MFALSCVTGRNITLVYPEIIGKETKYSKFLNVLITPRTEETLLKSKESNHLPPLIFLWSSSGTSYIYSCIKQVILLVTILWSQKPGQDVLAKDPT